jgi:hypothetical protein
MVSLLVAFSVILPFVGLAFALYRVLSFGISRGKLGPFSACCIYWLAVAVLPRAITRGVVPVANYIYTTYPSLQEAAWDVGLAIVIFIGMWVSYVLAVVAGGVASWRFVQQSKIIKLPS